MLIDTLLKEGYLEPLDLYFASLHDLSQEEETALLAAVMQSAREGHLCLNLNAIPLPLHDKKEEWRQLVLKGSTLPIKSPYLVRQDERIYLQKNYQYETDILHELKRLRGKEPLAFCSTTLESEQKTAFELVREHKVSIIEGGPGTGKTYLTSELVKSFGEGASILLTAPTGKAAARLKENNPAHISGTLHSLLGVRASQNLFIKKSFLEADLIVVDESSMLDAKMMRFLLKSLPNHQRIVFLGDGNQLPPVETGSLFCDLIDLVPTAHLKKCHRSDRKEVLEMAQTVLRGDMPSLEGNLSWENITQFIKCYQHEGVILTPLRQGPWGVEALNQRIDQMIQDTFSKERVVPIMITRNDAALGLSNGDMGLLRIQQETPLEAEFTLGKEVKRFSCSQLPPYEISYVLSVHKSQGSEFPHVLALVPPGSERFGKEMLYTAVTRAKESIHLLGDQEIVKKTLKVSSYRSSGLKNRWEAE
ncbi:ATP-dependent RecD-like DNA helicase [Rhabdochlamydiaceae symbiont of Dictyostelium giganteum]|uniref:ATP-dependent DNA helicase n=1 Tax=Rhabdochlamydiaceae symbiont of Dictyostelium giganteum TaxID=3342349 RepID=UPI00384C36C6